jgi:C4-dicarboxylate-specific signal transduction histidine kinase
LNPVPTPEGVLTLATITDISTRNAAEEEARTQREQIDLLSRVSLLGEMTASLAHELNQPLSAIVSNATAGVRFLDKGDVEPDTVREILVDVASDGRRAHDIIRNVRNTVKKGGAVRERISANEVVKRVVRMVHPEATTNSCEVETWLAGDLPPFDGDPVQIQQVLINLVSNAFDAMRETPVGQRKVELVTQRTIDGSVRISVRDYGPGVPEEGRDRLFDHFFTTKEDGLGMGLAIVRSIVEAHGGRIAAENMDGGGACFHFTLSPNGRA